MRKFLKDLYEAWAEARMAVIKARMASGQWY
jgi:hypothetical protein